MARRGRKPSATKEPKFHREANPAVYDLLDDTMAPWMSKRIRTNSPSKKSRRLRLRRQVDNQTIPKVRSFLIVKMTIPRFK